MRRVVLFIAMSLDGYIADRDGGVDWLAGQDPQAETPDTYSAFIKDVDTVIMGWNTYRQVTEELSPGHWVYGDLTCYVVTHRKLPARDRICFTGGDPCRLVADLRREPGRSIWICGGASLIRQLAEADLIDEYDISVIPTLLGGGIPLFAPTGKRTDLALVQSESRNGITRLIYRRRREMEVTP